MNSNKLEFIFPPSPNPDYKFLVQNGEGSSVQLSFVPKNPLRWFFEPWLERRYDMTETTPHEAIDHFVKLVMANEKAKAIKRGVVRGTAKKEVSWNEYETLHKGDS